MTNTMFRLLICIASVNICWGFLLTNNTVPSTGNGVQTLGSQNFHLVMDLISQEKAANTQLKQQVKQMETFVLGLQNDMEVMKRELHIAKLNPNPVQLRQSNTIALTACDNNGTVYQSGNAMKFTTIRTAHGVSNLQNLKTTGKFTCEQPGFYIFSVFITSTSSNAQYALYKNRQWLAQVYVAGQPTGFKDHHTGSGTIVVQLDIGDTLHADSFETMYVHERYSCMSVIKV